MSKEPAFLKFNGTIKDLFPDDGKYTFLVGAGCSIDGPSCLPSGKSMMNSMILHLCNDEDQEKILNYVGQGLIRFEALVEIIRDTYDENLKIIDYFGLSDKPNYIHYVLADMIKKGHYVMTTNFDYLIEYACLRSGISREDVIPVITQPDFEQYNDPQKLILEGKIPIYKIHGSKKNIISGEDTSDYLVATLQAFGSNKEGLNIFQLEYFKKALFNNISRGRTLVVMGYSGSDDFDIVPTLTILSDLKALIWIKHNPNQVKIEDYIFEIPAHSESSDKVITILKDVKKNNPNMQVFMLDVDTGALLRLLSPITPSLDSDSFAMTSKAYFEQNLYLDPITKSEISSLIHYSVGSYTDAIQSLNQMQNLSELEHDMINLAKAYSYLGCISTNMGHLQEALDFHSKSYEIHRSMDHHHDMGADLGNLSLTYRDMGSFQKALEFNEQSYKIFEELNEKENMANALGNLVPIYMQTGKHNLALECLNKSLELKKELGKVHNMAIDLGNLGNYYKEKGDRLKAMEFYDKAYKIHIELGDKRDMARILGNKGGITLYDGELQKAFDFVQESFNLYKELGEKHGLADQLSLMGLIYARADQHHKAMEMFQQSYTIFQEIGSKKEATEQLVNIGGIYKILGQREKTFELFKQAYFIFKEINDDNGRAKVLGETGILFMEAGQYEKALESYNHAYEINVQLNNLERQGLNLGSIGNVFKEQGDYEKALDYYEKAYKIHEQIDYKYGIGLWRLNKGFVYANKGEFEHALELVYEAQTIFQSINSMHELLEIKKTIADLKEDIQNKTNSP